MENMTKGKKLYTLSRLINNLHPKRKEKKVIFCSGAYDLFHIGHFRALKKASKLGNILIVQIDGNELVKKRKGSNRPYLHEKERAEVIASLTFVDFVFISNTPSEDASILGHLKPNIFVRAILPNETDKDRKNREKILLSKIPDGKIVWLSQTKEISTTKIIPLVQ